MALHIYKKKVFRLKVGASLALAVMICACAGASRPPQAGAPRGANDQPYPILIAYSPERQQAVLAAWATLTQNSDAKPDLQPVTATVKSLPTTSTGNSLYLPKVTEQPLMNEEETRESLRRFISSEPILVGAKLPELSLTLRTDVADGTKRARYEQRPFAHPLRGGYGILEISFATDRRITQITSTCLPDVEKYRRTIYRLAPVIKVAEDAAKAVRGKAFTVTDDAGNTQNVTVSASDALTVRELVIYPLLRENMLELHLAWEIVYSQTTSSSTKAVYLDAVSGDILGARPV
ncbi:MAG TPA: hypothetical protein VK619_02810 [Pyrinomonadaceae bacterium]|nr:hypothetical protein [Pyrinomonadaceae bacterium]